MLHAPINEKKTRVGTGNTALLEQERQPNSATLLEYSPLISVSNRFSPGNIQTQLHNQLAALQNTYGNQAVLRMKGRSPTANPLQEVLQRKCACGNSAGSTGSCAEYQSKQEGILQTKLQISEPGDRYEQEADRIADQVMRIPASFLQNQIGPEVKKEKEMIQTKAIAQQGTSEVPSIVYEVLNSSGHPLDPETRAFMEPRFGHDFSQVRTYHDTRAAKAAQAVNAQAYTMKRDIVFGAGQYAPATAQGKKLLAHELVHVIQQDATATHALQGQAAGTADKDSGWHPEFPGCSTDQSTQLDNLLLLAQMLVIGSISDLESEMEPSLSGIITRARSALIHNFHTEDPKDIKIIISRFERILIQLEKGPKNIRCLSDPKCTTFCRGLPFACAAPRVPISVCSSVFDETRIIHPLFYVVVLIHEAAHQVGAPFHSYDATAQKQVPNERQLALRSANSYADFAEDRSLGGRGTYNFHRSVTP